MTDQTSKIQPTERLQVELQSCPCGKRFNIRLEAYDAGLGWYTSGCMSLPLAQLPLLEQAIADMRNVQNLGSNQEAVIIPFPGCKNAFECGVAVDA
jgi:hypothetical protein